MSKMPNKTCKILRNTKIFAILLTTFLGASNAAHAATSTYSTTQVITDGALNDFDGSLSGAAVTTTTLKSYASDTGFSSGSATSIAEIGSLKVKAEAFSASAGSAQGATAANSYADARWTDSFIVSGGVVGTQGYITAIMLADGLASSTMSSGQDSNSFSYGGLNLTLVGTGLSPQTFDSSYSSTSTSVSNPIGNILLYIPFYFGFSTDLRYQLTGSASSYAYNSSGFPSASADLLLDYSHTVKWGGITGVFDAWGNQITGFSVASASGFDYVGAQTAGVPEPATWALMIGAFGLAGIALRRRHRSITA